MICPTEAPATGLPPSKPSVERITTQRSSSLFQISTPAPSCWTRWRRRSPILSGTTSKTVERLTPQVRSRARYAPRSARWSCSHDAAPRPKSGLMLGLGESDDEVLQTLRDLRRAGVRIVTLGQYLRPTLEHYPVAEYITPEKFEAYRQQALAMGFDYCASAPMVRSSYRAQEALAAIKNEKSETRH